jgi:hypothetical protein
MSALAKRIAERCSRLESAATASSLRLALPLELSIAPEPSLEPELFASASGGASDFGTINGQQTIDELKDTVSLWEERMTSLGNSFAAFSPTWVGRDVQTMAAWSDDYQALTNRYSAAHAAAQSAISLAAWNPLPGNMIVAQKEFDGLAKAMRQNYPPDSATTKKGDWFDLYNRLHDAQTAAGAPPIEDHPPQPQATDVDLQALQVSQPFDPIAVLTGALAPPKTGPLSVPPFTWLKWLVDHKKGVMIAGGVLVGGVVLFSVMPILLLPAKLAKGATAALSLAA